MIIPALVVFARIPIKTAIGTSLLIISAKSLTGFLGDLGAGREIAWGLLLTVTGSSGLGILIGTYLSNLISSKHLKPAFGWFVLVMGVYIFALQFN